MFIFGTSSERERTVPTNDGKGVVAREEEEKGGRGHEERKQINEERKGRRRNTINKFKGNEARGWGLNHSKG